MVARAARRVEVVAPEQLRVEQVERGNVERGGHPDSPAEIAQAGGIVEAGPAEVEGPVDMGAGDVDQAAGAGCSGQSDQQAHGDGVGLAEFPGQHGPVLGAQVETRHQITADSGMVEPVSNRRASKGARSKVGTNPRASSAR